MAAPRRCPHNLAPKWDLHKSKKSLKKLPLDSIEYWMNTLKPNFRSAPARVLKAFSFKSKNEASEVFSFFTRVSHCKQFRRVPFKTVIPRDLLIMRHYIVCVGVVLSLWNSCTATFGFPACKYKFLDSNLTKHWSKIPYCIVPPCSVTLAPPP